MAAVSRRRFLKQAGMAGLATSFGLPGSRRTRSQAQEIPVGLVVGLTGAAAAWGIPVRDAVQMGVDEINASGGIRSKGGARIRLYVTDHQSTPRLAGTLVERVATLQNVLAVIGNATSASTVVGSEAAERYRMPMLSTDLAESLTQRGLRYFFRVSPKTSILGRVIVEFAKDVTERTGRVPRRIAVLADDTTFSQDGANSVLRALRELGIRWEVFDNVRYPGGAVTDFTPIIQRLKLANVDLVFQATFAPDGVQIVRTMKAVDYNPLAAMHVAGAPYTPEFNQALGDDANYVFDSVGFVPELLGANELIAGFARRYQARYGRLPDDQASLAYQVVGVLYDALERAEELSREALATALRRIDLQVGANPFMVRQGVQFDENGDNVRARALVMQILNRQQRIVYPHELATTRPVFPAPLWSQRT